MDAHRKLVNRSGWWNRDRRVKADAQEVADRTPAENAKVDRRIVREHNARVGKARIARVQHEDNAAWLDVLRETKARPGGREVET